MEETKQQVTRNCEDERNRNKAKLFDKINSSSALEGSILAEREKYNELDKKKAELLKEAARKSSSSAPAKGMVTQGVMLFKDPNNTSKTKRSIYYVPPLTGYFKWFEDPPNDGTPIPDPPADYIPPIPVEEGPCGYMPMSLEGRDYRLVYAFAGEAVKEYNSRQLEDNDKLKLVKVTKVEALAVAGYRFDLTFEAKVVGDGEEGKTHTYFASLWLKIENTLELTEFKLVDDGQRKVITGKKDESWKNNDIFTSEGVRKLIEASRRSCSN